MIPTGRAAAQPVVINELLAANDATAVDPDFGDASDWIELRNTGSEPVDLGGWFLSDDEADPYRWRIPDGTIIPGNGYLVVWADGRDTGLHASFALDRGGERAMLADPGGTPVDSVEFGAQRADVSYGRDASGAWVFLLDPSPGEANTGPAVTGFLDPPVFDRAPGFHDGSVDVVVSSPDPEAVVRYSTDGAPPTESSPVATGPIPIGSTTVLRATAFRPGYASGGPATATYFIDELPTLPVLSLSTDPANFFDDQIGIYVKGTNGVPGFCRSEPHNWNQDWERPIHVEFFEPDGAGGFAMDAGVKIFGGCTRIYDQKSLALYARSRYGTGKIDYPVFPWLDVDRFEAIVLRTSAQDWWRTMFRDGMIQTLIAQGMSIETQAYRPAVVFLNGQYWGIHNIREKLNEHYFADHFGFEPEQIEILQNDKEPINGHSAHFDALMAFVRSPDVAAPDGYDRASEWIDMDAYLDYLVAEIYSGNADWPGNNLKLWRPMTPEGRWRWVIYDLDMGFGGNQYSQTGSNTLAHATSTEGELWSNPPWSTELLRRLLLNDRFRHRFIQRMAAHMNTTFEPGRVERVIDSLKANIAPEIPRHKARWPKSMSYADTWEALIRIVRDFARGRAMSVRGHFGTAFGLPGSARLHLATDPAGAGTVEAAGVPMPTGGAGPVFFRGVPVELRARPADGWHFVRWESDLSADTDTVTTTLSGETWVTAVFAPGSVAREPKAMLPARYSLEQSYPNPARDRIDIAFDIPGPGRVALTLHDVLGRQVAVLAEGMYPAGRHTVRASVGALPAGVYVYTLQVADHRASRRLTVLR